MAQHQRILGISAACVLSMLLPSLSHAGTWVAFQNSYTRGTGSPVTVTDAFTLLNPNTQYTLKAYNGGLQNDTTELVSNSVVFLNGAQVVGPSNFNQSVAEVNVTIFPGLTNTLSVQVRGKPGGVLTIQVIGVDNDPPTITAGVSPSPNAAGWNNSPVTVTFTCSDKTSGVASCPSPITVSTEGANQVVSGTATDLAGNTASTSVTINLDMTPPTITGTINPPPDAGGYNSGPVTVTFNCADALSGVASCSPAVSFANEGPNQTTTGTAVDVAGNTATTTITVNISLSYFKIRSWQTNPPGDPLQTGKCLDYGSSASGATVFLNDCANAHPIRILEIGVTPPPCATATPPTCPPPPPPRMGSGGTPLFHEVMLFAGNGVIGVYNPQTISSGGTAPPPQPVTEYQLAVQAPYFSPRGSALFTAAQQIWRLDGDSIILEGSHVELQPDTLLPIPIVVPGPCISGDASVCPAPSPQLVIQVQNARGASSSPLVAAVRNLSDNEFWDFIPGPGSRPYPTSGFTPVASPDSLWNAICSNPQALPVTNGDITAVVPPIAACSPGGFNAGWGTVILVSSPSDCAGVPGPLTGQTQDIGGCLDLSQYPPFALPSGATIRGNRRGTNFGPQLYFSFASWKAYSQPLGLSRPGGCNEDTCVLEVHGDYVRITGLRLRGESRAPDNSAGKTIAIQVDYPGSAATPPAPQFNLASVTEFIATVDHNDASDWGESPVEGQVLFNYQVPDGSGNRDKHCMYVGFKDNSGHGWYGCDQSNQLVPPQDSPPYPPATSGDVAVANDAGTLANIRVARNFLHHNLRDDGGYGASVRGRALIDKNTFVWNRHDITADAEPHNEFRASNNIVLSSTHNYGGIIGRLQDFDMHGTDNSHFCYVFGCTSLWIGGAGGYYVEIDGNTFLGNSSATGGTGHDYVLRGYPVINSYYHHNVSLRNQGDAVQFTHCVVCISSDFPITVSGDNQFADSSPAYTDPTTRLGPAVSLGIGDFDGDGDDDLFLATGAAWYYSTAGAREWRFLNAAPDTVDQLLFGDFDGDGRTDVVAMRSGQLVISWGGISAFDVLNYNPCTNVVPVTCPSSVTDLAVGDFDGDGKPDIFWADGTNWWVSFGGNTPFVKVQSSSFHVSDLRFGDFNGDGTTDVLGVVSYGGSNYYQVSFSPKGAPGALFSGWIPLQPALTNSAGGVVVADFNGDGVADVLAPSSDGWQISYGGSQPWTDVSQTQTLGSFGYFSIAGVGHFKGQLQTDVLVWNGFLHGFVPPTGLDISAAGVSPAIAYSTQDMR